MTYDLVITSHGPRAMADGTHAHADSRSMINHVGDADRYTIVTAANGNKYRVLRDDLDTPDVKAFFAKINKRFSRPAE